MFTIPCDVAYEQDVSARIMRESTLKEVKKQLDWIEIIPHGLVHMPREFEKCDYDTMKLSMKAIDEAFKKDDLPYVKGFKAPFWLWNEQVVKALDDEGWWGAVDRDGKSPVPKKYYVFNYKIDEPFFLAKNIELMKLHGHITPEKNNIERCFVNLFRMPSNAEFVFASECVEDNEYRVLGK
jgi:predicted deacetylase